MILAVGMLALAIPFLWSLAPLGQLLAGASNRVLELREGRWVSSDSADDERFSAPGRVRAGWGTFGTVAVYGPLRERVPSGLWLTDIAALPDGHVVAVGHQGLVAARSPDGAWTVLQTGGPTLRAIAVTGEGIAYAAGHRGTLLRVHPEVAVLAGGRGPDISELRVGRRGATFLARPTAAGSPWRVALFWGLAIIVNVMFVTSVLAAWGRVRAYRRARGYDRAWKPPVLEAEGRPGGAFGYELTLWSLRAVGPATVVVRLVALDIQERSRVRRYAVGREHVLEARGAVGPHTIQGELIARMDASDGVALDWAFEVELTSAEGAAAYSGACP